MGRDAKPHHKITIKLDVYSYERLTEMANATGATMTSVIEQLIDRAYVETYGLMERSKIDAFYDPIYGVEK